MYKTNDAQMQLLTTDEQYPDHPQAVIFVPQSTTPAYILSTMSHGTVTLIWQKINPLAF